MTRNTRTHDHSDAASFDPDSADLADRKRDLMAFIETIVDDAGAEGVVVNLSGGVDSTVTATLAVEALGSERVSGLVLPADANAAENLDDAHRVAEDLGIDYNVVEIQPLVDQLMRTLTSETRELNGDPLRHSTRTAVVPTKEQGDYRAAIGNMAARLRMTVAYFEANVSSRLVIGTGNRTELLLGYFTKHGDGGVDFLPIGDLYKTEVRALARHLGVRRDIVEKPPTAGLWEGQVDESELGAPYEVIDAILHSLVDLNEDVETVATELDVDDELVREYATMYEQAAHKRTPPPTPSDYPTQS